MKPLFVFADQHPAGTGIVGVASGILSPLLAMLHAAAGVAADIGAILAAGSSLLCVLILTHKWIHRNDWVTRRARELEDEDRLS